MPTKNNLGPEEKNLLAVIGDSSAFRAKFGGFYDSPFKKEIKRLSVAAEASPDPIKFLLGVVKQYNAKYKGWTPDKKVAPGKMYAMPTPNEPIGDRAAGFMPSAEKQAKAAALQAKIDAHNAEIERLRKARLAAENAKKAAEAQHKKVGTRFDEKTLKYFSYIEKNCSEYLTAVRATGRVLYRGQYDSKMPIFVGYPRKNRQPKDSDEKAQKIYDENLTIMGFDALRSNSIFTTSDFNQAEGYGNLYAIFPKNGFKFTWATKEADLVLDSVLVVTGSDSEDKRSLFYKYEDYVSNISDDFSSFEETESDNNTKQFNKIKKMPEYKALESSIDKWDDVDYYDDTEEEIRMSFIRVGKAFRDFSAVVPEFKKIVGAVWFKKNIAALDKAMKEVANKKSVSNKVEAEKMVKRFGLLHDNMVAALKSGHEVCVLGEYIAVDAETYEDQIKLYFLKKDKPVKK